MTLLTEDYIWAYGSASVPVNDPEPVPRARGTFDLGVGY